jgi:hypothetical protein
MGSEEDFERAACLRSLNITHNIGGPNTKIIVSSIHVCVTNVKEILKL